MRLSRRVKKVFKVVKMEEKIAKDFLAARNYADKILIMKDSTATVDLAAQALGCEPARIAKTLSFDVREKTVMLVCAGTAKVDNKKFKETFSTKAKMLRAEEVADRTGFPVGGVCPFTEQNDGLEIYLDDSLKVFDYVYPACGTPNTAIKLTIQELEDLVEPKSWVAVTK